MERLTKTEKQMLNLNKELEHLGVDIKYIPKDVMNDKDIQKSLNELSEVLQQMLEKLKKHQKKMIGKKVTVRVNKAGLYNIVEKKHVKK